MVNKNCVSLISRPVVLKPFTSSVEFGSTTPNELFLPSMYTSAHICEARVCWPQNAGFHEWCRLYTRPVATVWVSVHSHLDECSRGGTHRLLL